MIFATVNGGFLFGFSVGSRNSDVLHIFHLLFAYDTLIFCGANADHIFCLCALFLRFEAVSDLKVNLAKLKLVHVGNFHNVDRLVSILGCGVSYLPLKYLGLPLGAYFKAKSIWEGVIEKIECRLAGWKMMYLFEGGRITLIKSTLFNCWCCQSHRKATTRFLVEWTT
jgi:hypothetical protein